eukprot:1376019-Amorphochlora_amoeboformis.AAC.1
MPERHTLEVSLTADLCQGERSNRLELFEVEEKGDVNPTAVGLNMVFFLLILIPTPWKIDHPCNPGEMRRRSREFYLSVRAHAGDRQKGREEEDRVGVRDYWDHCVFCDGRL